MSNYATTQQPSAGKKSFEDKTDEKDEKIDMHCATGRTTAHVFHHHIILPSTVWSFGDDTYLLTLSGTRSSSSIMIFII